MKSSIRNIIVFISSLIILSVLAWLFVFNGYGNLKTDIQSLTEDKTSTVNIGFIGSKDDFMNAAYSNVNTGLTVLKKDLNYDKSDIVSEIKTSDDGLIWDFTLKPGLKWSDGSQIKATDIADIMKNKLDSCDSYACREMKKTIASVSVSDATTDINYNTGSLKFTLNKPMALLPFLLASNEFSITNTTNNANTDDNNSNAVSSGAYSVVNSEITDNDGIKLAPDDNTIILRKNAYYVNPALSSFIRIELFNDDASALKAINDGSVSYVIKDSDVSNANSLDSKKYTVKRGYSTRRTVLVFNGNLNMDKPLLSDAHVRQGFRQALNNAELMKSLNNDGNVMTNSLLPGSFVYNADTSYPFDPAHGRYLSTSYFGVRQTRLLWQANRGHAFGEAVDNQLAQIVQYTKWEEVDDNTYNQMVNDKNYEMVLMDMKGIDVFKDLLNGNSLTSIDNQPDVDTAYASIYAAKNTDELKQNIYNMMKAEDEASFIDNLYAHKSTVIKTNNMNDINADFIDASMNLHDAGASVK